MTTLPQRTPCCDGVRTGCRHNVIRFQSQNLSAKDRGDSYHENTTDLSYRFTQDLHLSHLEISQAKVARPHAQDCVLVDRLVRGDAEAWREFVVVYGRLVRSRVADVAASFGRGADSTAIDDAVAEVFAALLNNHSAALRGYAGKSSLVTYLAVIATRSATRGFARTAPINSASPDASTSIPDPDAADPIGEAIRNERCDQVRRLVARLPEKQQNIVELFHLRGQSYQQISQQLNIPIGSVGATLKRAEQKLKSWLEQ